MEQNIGTIDRYIRLTAGFYLLGVGIKKSSNILMITGSMKIAEGITKWCPMLYILKKSTIGKTCCDDQQTPEDPLDTQIPVT